MQRADGLRPLEVGDALSAGDRVQLWYDPRNADAVGFAGRDGTGAIEVYGVIHPTADGLQPAPFSLTLDGASGNQEFFVVPGAASLDDAAVRRAVLDLSPDVRRMVIPKEPLARAAQQP